MVQEYGYDVKPPLEAAQYFLTWVYIIYTLWGVKTHHRV